MNLNVTVSSQEGVVSVLENLTGVRVFDLGCAAISIGKHPEFGMVIVVCGNADKAALIPVS